MKRHLWRPLFRKARLSLKEKVNKRALSWLAMNLTKSANSVRLPLSLMKANLLIITISKKASMFIRRMQTIRNHLNRFKSQWKNLLHSSMPFSANTKCCCLFFHGCCTPYLVLWAAPQYENKSQLIVKSSDSGNGFDPSSLLMAAGVSGASGGTESQLVKLYSVCRYD